jgi:hypothetical protein
VKNELAAASEKSRCKLQEQLSKTEASCLRLMNEASQNQMQQPKAKPKSKAKASPKRKHKTDVDLFVEAQMAFPLECGEGGAERQQRDRDIQKYYEGLLCKRDGEKTNTTNAKKQTCYPSPVFNGARSGYCYKLGSQGLAEVTIIAETDSKEDDEPPSTPSSSESFMSEHADDLTITGPSQEFVAAMCLRIENEHWDAHGYAHPNSGFQVGTAPLTSSSSTPSSSSSSRKLKSKKSTRKNSTKKLAAKSALPKSLKRGARVSKKNAESNTDDSRYLYEILSVEVHSTVV